MYARGCASAICVLHVVPQRRFLALEVAEQLVRQHLVDRPHAIGPLGVAGPGVVLDEEGWVMRSVVMNSTPRELLAHLCGKHAGLSPAIAAIPASEFRQSIVIPKAEDIRLVIPEAEL